jgi:serine/threonine protein kinase
MEYCPGGDLMTVLMREDILSEKNTRFYMSELAQAIWSVHKLGFAHRYFYFIFYSKSLFSFFLLLLRDLKPGIPVFLLFSFFSHIQKTKKLIFF